MKAPHFLVSLVALLWMSLWPLRGLANEPTSHHSSFIEGTWHAVSEVCYDAAASKTTRERFNREGELAMRITLHTNGSFLGEEFYDGKWNAQLATYKLSGLTISIDYGTTTDMAVVEQLTPHKLVVLLSDEMGNWTRRVYER